MTASTSARSGFPTTARSRSSCAGRAEPRGLVGESVARSGWPRSRGLGGEDRRHRCVAPRVDDQQRAGCGGGRGGGPELSPDGKYVVFVTRRPDLSRASARGATAAIDTGGVPFIKEWGRQSNPHWSPDGSKLAFVSTRDNHSLHRRVRHEEAYGGLPRAECRLRRQPDVVARRQTDRVHPPPGHAVRRADAAGSGRHRQSGRSAARGGTRRWWSGLAAVAVARSRQRRWRRPRWPRR